ncbi:hypothetical protein [Kingella sp. (in: b-proteobacteria)]|uniref:hypothetical protein n=1 Tax=Kingella sp. (in: b-proteobacteria) TaxID=2020713 RepID=UPI0026DD1FAA|nr:hypothetical protein [Kingella sp. (in: b-proteobacteria)]MDO4658139.1 hypothetical protein [Kingella sp. (in: b-proteobacteria)]
MPIDGVILISGCLIRLNPRQPETNTSRFRLPFNIFYFLPEQAFRRLPRAGASPCTPP